MIYDYDMEELEIIGRVAVLLGRLQSANLEPTHIVMSIDILNKSPWDILYGLPVIKGSEVTGNYVSVAVKA